MRMRIPRPSLRPFVESIWAADDTADTLAMPARREHVLPTGHMHLVLRLADDPLRIFDDVRDVTGRVVGTAVVGGARERFYVREVSRWSRKITSTASVRAQIRDPFGHRWSIGHHIEDVSPDEMQRRYTEQTGVK